MSQEAIDYIKSRIISTDFITEGDIKTTCKITLDNGIIVDDLSIREISSFQQDEAQQAAYDKALKVFYPGVNLILSKK